MGVLPTSIGAAGIVGAAMVLFVFLEPRIREGYDWRLTDRTDDLSFAIVCIALAMAISGAFQFIGRCTARRYARGAQ
jgi:hypothetical protein